MAGLAPLVWLHSSASGHAAPLLRRSPQRRGELEERDRASGGMSSAGRAACLKRDVVCIAVAAEACGAESAERSRLQHPC